MTTPYDRPSHYSVSSLDDFFKLILAIGKQTDIMSGNTHTPLWFRGHTYSYWNLLPSVFREGSLLTNRKHTYSNLHLLEDYRYQNFRSRAAYQTPSGFLTAVEWHEVMQHHFTPTRLMDWSESAIVALTFALECYINPDGRQAQRNALDRATGSPNIWVLDPQSLNEHVYNCISRKNADGRYPYIELAFKTVIQNPVQRRLAACRIGSELSANKDLYLDFHDKPQLNRLISLAAIDSQRSICSDRLLEMVKNFEFNPFHYVVARCYIDRLILPIQTVDDLPWLLPPIATVHPYHSDRIQVQKGAFTSVPYYQLSSELERLQQIGIDVRAMEHQPSLAGCLTNIALTDPDKMAEELMRIGVRETDLYPEMEKYSQFMEQSN